MLADPQKLRVLIDFVEGQYREGYPEPHQRILETIAERVFAKLDEAELLRTRAPRVVETMPWVRQAREVAWVTLERMAGSGLIPLAEAAMGRLQGLAGSVDINQRARALAILDGILRNSTHASLHPRALTLAQTIAGPTPPPELAVAVNSIMDAARRSPNPEVAARLRTAGLSGNLRTLGANASGEAIKAVVHGNTTGTNVERLAQVRELFTSHGELVFQSADFARRTLRAALELGAGDTSIEMLNARRAFLQTALEGLSTHGGLPENVMDTMRGDGIFAMVELGTRIEHELASVERAIAERGNAQAPPAAPRPPWWRRFMGGASACILSMAMMGMSGGI